MQKFKDPQYHFSKLCTTLFGILKCLLIICCPFEKKPMSMNSNYEAFEQLLVFAYWSN
jgi:hypothetical protein